MTITDISFSKTAIKSGAYTALSQYNTTDAQNPWWLHMHSPEIDAAKYISKVGVVTAGKYDDSNGRYHACGYDADPYNKIYCELLNQGFTQCVPVDFNHGTSKGDSVVIGYTLTNNKNKALTNIITSEKNQETITVNGITYTRGTGVSLNATLKYGNNIYLYYTLDANAGNPIMGLHGALSTSQGTEYLQRQEGGISNLNLNAADSNPDCNGNYLPAIYLGISRDGAPKQNASLSASVFSENPQMKLIVAVAGMAVLVSVITVIVKKRKAKSQK